MKLSADEEAALRTTVRDHLERSPAYRPLPPDQRSRLAGDMVTVMDARIADVDPASARGLLAAVDFPAFVAGLVAGTFEANVDASISQMEAYAELVRGVARGVSERPDARLLGPLRPGLDLPDLDLPDLAASGDAPVPENIRSMAAIYLAYELEELRLFAVVDRLAELCRAGHLPLRRDSDALTLLAHPHDHLSRDERRAAFDKVLCAGEGEALWRQFLTAVAAAVDGAPEDPRPPPLLAPVRTAGLSLARLASERGAGPTRWIAQQLVDQAKRSLAVVDHPEIQAAFAARDRWQLIERVASTHLGAPPDIAGRRARASAGVVLLDWLADRAASLAAGPLALAAIAEPVERWLSVPPHDPPRRRRVVPRRPG